MTDTTVSVLMPAWNAAASLAESVQSVQAQTHQDWRLIIVDDGSSDRTFDVAQSLSGVDPRIVVLRLPTKSGASAARNRALEAAEGRYIAFLDSDDIWYPDKLTAQLAMMRERDAAFGFCAFHRKTPQGRMLVPVPAQLDHRRLLRGNVVGCLTAIYDTGKLGKIPMPDLRLRQDYALWLKILRPGIIGHGLNVPLAEHRRRSGSLSSDPFAALRGLWRVYREQERLNPAHAATCVVSHYANRFAAVYLRGSRTDQ